MHTFRLPRTLLVSLVFCAIPAASLAINAQASILIEQISPSTTGVWTMLSSAGTIRTSNDEGVDARRYSIGITDYGQTVLSVIPPAGMSVRITVFRGGEQIAQTDSQQYAFTVRANDNYRFVLQYALTKLGTLGITSEPSGTRFRMRGPSGRTYAGRSPQSFTNIPAGRYTVMFPALHGCTDATRKPVIVEANDRNVLHVSLATCNAVDDSSLDYSRISKRQLRDLVLEREQKPRGERK